MKQEYKHVKFRADSLGLIDTCQEILERYAGMGLRVTLRQLYYQLVVSNAIPNSEKSYKRVGNILSDARLAGLIDWDAIEDRVRRPVLPQQWRDVADMMDTAADAFRLPRRADQPAYVELWVEKDALANVLQPIARKYHITLMVNRGYSSQSAMHEAAQRFISARLDGIRANRLAGRGLRGGECRLLYLGDHDPSGEDMVRDVADRLAMFEARVTVEKVALTRAQVDEYDPPPNPAKTTDARYAKYAAEHGDESWEVDAIPPEELTRIVEAAVEVHTDMDLYEAAVEREEELREQIRSFHGEES